jgi:transposase InsO family protein
MLSKTPTCAPRRRPKRLDNQTSSRPRKWVNSNSNSRWPKAFRFTSKALDEWAWRPNVKLDYTRPGKPMDNRLIESFNGWLRDEFPNVNEFIAM